MYISKVKVSLEKLYYLLIQWWSLVAQAGPYVRIWFQTKKAQDHNGLNLVFFLWPQMILWLAG